MKGADYLTRVLESQPLVLETYIESKLRISQSLEYNCKIHM